MNNFSKMQVIRKPALKSNSGMVSSQHALASQVGADVLAAGGNAADAAVAVSFCIGVHEPWMSGPAGGGALVYQDVKTDQVYAIDFGMRSSRNLDMSLYQLTGAGVAGDLFPWLRVTNDQNLSGIHAVAVPGCVAGLGLLHKNFGSMPWKELLAPAINSAKEGFLVDWYAALLVSSASREIVEDADLANALLDEGRWPVTPSFIAEAARRIKINNLASSLERIAHAGPDDFYSGDIAKSLSDDILAKGGCIDRTDLAEYKATLSSASVYNHRDYNLYTAPELNAGPTLVDAFTRAEINKGGQSEPDLAWYSNIVSSLRTAQEKRYEDDGDLSGKESCTTHFSIADKQGNLLACTQTLLSLFGSKVLSPSTGFMLNNGIMWFDPELGKANSLAPNKRCLMNICPIIGESKTRQFALGASGGRKILSSVAMITAYLTEFDMTLEQAFENPRIDCSLTDQVIIDPKLPEDVKKGLKQQFNCPERPRTVFPTSFGTPSAVLVEKGNYYGCTETMVPWADSRAPDLV